MTRGQRGLTQASMGRLGVWLHEIDIVRAKITVKMVQTTATARKTGNRTGHGTMTEALPLLEVGATFPASAVTIGEVICTTTEAIVCKGVYKGEPVCCKVRKCPHVT
jgi:hypothetical protein